MLRIAPQMRLLVAIEPADFRKGIDGLAQFCRQALGEYSLGGALFVFRNRRVTAVKALVYDGQEFWLYQKRLERGTFERPRSADDGVNVELDATDMALLLAGVELKSVKRRPRYRRACAVGAPQLVGN